ncbi:MAG: hypothetical protein Q9163_000686 [Psora crenata]
MEGASSTERGASWMSVTGEPLELGSQVNDQGRCASESSFERLNRLGEGSKFRGQKLPNNWKLSCSKAYGVVYRAKDRSTSQIVAIKQVRIPIEERQNGVPITALREISILRSLKHSNIINVVDVAVGDQSMDEVYMVMEYAEQVGDPRLRISTRGLGAPGWLMFLAPEKAGTGSLFRSTDQYGVVKCLFRQLLEGLEYLHKNEIVHRDVKMQNLLLTAKGVLKIADFGMARAYSPRPLTPGVVTIWYRAPEVLLGTKYYTPSIDIWSAGLVLAEMLLGAPCLTGETAIEQLSLIIRLLGSPTPDDLAALSAMGCPDLIRWRGEGFSAGRADNVERKFRPSTSSETVVFLKGLLQWDPHARWTAAEALGSGRSQSSATAEKWWRESPRAIQKELLPTYPEVRNKAEGQKEPYREKQRARDDTVMEGNAGDYIFDFAEDNGLKRPLKRPRAR